MKSPNKLSAAGMLLTAITFGISSSPAQRQAPRSMFLAPEKADPEIELCSCAYHEEQGTFKVAARDSHTLDIDVPDPPEGFRIPTVYRTEASASLVGTSVGSITVGGSAGAPSSGGATGYKTTFPGEPTHSISGRIRFNYTDRQPDHTASASRDDYPFRKNVKTSTKTGVIRHAAVVLQDDYGHYIKGKLNSEGRFHFDWIPVQGTNGTITVWSVIDGGNNRRAAVGKWKGGDLASVNSFTNNPGDYLAYSHTSSFSLDDARIEGGMDGAELEIVIPNNHESAKAFFQLDQSLVAVDYFRQISGVFSFPKINLIYTPNHTVSDSTSGIYVSSIDPGFVHIASEPTDFGWSGFAVRHEVAHVFQKHYIRPHTYGKLKEPLANVHALAMVGTSWMDKMNSFEDLDFQANYVDGEFRLSTSGGSYWEYCDGCEWDASSGWAQRVFWDLVDKAEDIHPEPIDSYFPAGSNSLYNAGTFDEIWGGGGENESNDGGDHVLNEVLIDYLGGGTFGSENPDYTDRGYAGVDVVDVLDGILYHGHATPSQVETLMNQGMLFGYESP